MYNILYHETNYSQLVYNVYKTNYSQLIYYIYKTNYSPQYIIYSTIFMKRIKVN